MVDLTLPKTAATEKYNDECDFDKFAVYTLVKLSNDGLRDLEKALLSDEYEYNDDPFPVDTSRDFTMSSLHEVLLYHLSIAESKELNPLMFMAIHDADFATQGVILVNANFDSKCGVDKRRVPVADAVITLVNIQWANSDWGEIESLDPPSEEALTVPKEDPYKDVSTPKIYAAYGLYGRRNLREFHELVQPDWSDLPERLWRIGAGGPYEGPDALAEVAKSHPGHCYSETDWDRQWIICVDNDDPATEGVLLVHINWDGNIDQDADRLSGIVSMDNITIERCDVRTILDVLDAKPRE